MNALELLRSRVLKLKSDKPLRISFHWAFFTAAISAAPVGGRTGPVRPGSPFRFARGGRWRSVKMELSRSALYIRPFNGSKES